MNLHSPPFSISTASTAVTQLSPPYSHTHHKDYLQKQDLREKLSKIASTIDWQPQKGANYSHLRKEYFVNLSAFPSEYKTEDDALLGFNDLGQWHKI